MGVWEQYRTMYRECISCHLQLALYERLIGGTWWLTDNLFIVSHERGTFPGWVQSIISKPSLGNPFHNPGPCLRGEELTQGRELVDKTGSMVVVGDIPKGQTQNVYHQSSPLCLIATGNGTAHSDQMVHGHLEPFVSLPQPICIGNLSL